MFSLTFNVRFHGLLLGCFVGTLGFLPAAAAAQDSAPRSASVIGTNRAGAFKMLFSSPQDLLDPWGKLHFGFTPVRKLGDFPDLGFTWVAAFPLSNGACEVFGQRSTEVRAGAEPWQRMIAWRLLRTTTRDGVGFAPPETVFEQSAAFTAHVALAQNGDTGEYLILKFKVDPSGFAYTAYFSPDGRNWKAHPGNPLFYDGDAMSLFWSQARHRFVCVSKTLQPYRKHLLDHGGATPSLRDDSLRDRRVLIVRSSADGRTWEPAVSLADVWNRNGRKAPIASEFLTVPDPEDPPDLEFYSGNAFWYHDRAYMMVLNYAASPLTPRQHAPQLDTEWWTSLDGLRWERPSRGVNALDVFPQIPRLETPPFLLNGQLQFPRGKMLLGLPEDRVSYVGARANGEFSTRPFRMPAAGLFLNIAVPSLDRPFARSQAYVRVAVLDEHGQLIPGFEAEKCQFREMDRSDGPLQWGDASPRQLTGRTLQLRFHLRSASIYAVTAHD